MIKIFCISPIQICNMISWWRCNEIIFFYIFYKYFMSLIHEMQIILFLHLIVKYTNTENTPFHRRTFTKHHIFTKIRQITPWNHNVNLWTVSIWFIISIKRNNNWKRTLNKIFKISESTVSFNISFEQFKLDFIFHISQWILNYSKICTPQIRLNCSYPYHLPLCIP